MKPKVIFIDSVHEVLQERLEYSGFQCDLHFHTSWPDVENILHEYTGVVIRSRYTIDRNFIDKALQLRFIARSGSGLENIDVNYAASKGIAVFNSPEGNRDAVGEHAIAMLLSLFNKLNIADAQVRKGMWFREENRGIELCGKTVGLLGYGQMGSSMARKLSGFECTVIAFDKYRKNYSDSYAIEVSLDGLFERSDILSIHLPLTEETHYMVNESFLDRFQKRIYVINTARGKNVHTAGLVAAMKKGKVQGACLDVLEFEKSSLEILEYSAMPDEMQFLCGSERVILSPHIAGWTVESYRKLSSVLADKVLFWWKEKCR
ncbi:MAG: hydroxyacid dehydrogenase [Crocinitomicaceae bacterium]|nr:hydroxyacid dehydrogenase [Crocinitomicaceae bacterium]